MLIVDKIEFRKNFGDLLVVRKFLDNRIALEVYFA